MVKLFARDLKSSARVLDLETGKFLREVIWLDAEAGTAEAYKLDSAGRKVLTFDSDGAAAWETVLLKGVFKLVHPDDAIRPRAVDAIKMGAPKCARCASVLTLRGDDLCPICRAKDRGKPFKMERCGPFDFRKCMSCSRDATWSVSDEVEVTPQEATVAGGTTLRDGRYLFDRGATVGRRYYCSWCFKAPRLVDHKGEVIREDSSTVRPD